MLNYTTLPTLFPALIDWVLETIEYFKSRMDLQLVIRVHPAEIRGFVPSRQPLEKEIRQVYPELPRNVFVVGPESDVSTYALCDASNAVLIYNTKTGMEVTARGIPTIVAGEAWIRNKGFAKDPDDARRLL
jgi:capsule polysaccharide modification protein KpsS